MVCLELTDIHDKGSGSPKGCPWKRNGIANDHIVAIVRMLAPSLLALAGCGVLSAAKILGKTAGAKRFRSKAAFASWNGTAPLRVWSGNNLRHRVSRYGNRQVNAALHRIAITQGRGDGPSHASCSLRHRSRTACTVTLFPHLPTSQLATRHPARAGGNSTGWLSATNSRPGSWR